MTHRKDSIYFRLVKLLVLAAALAGSSFAAMEEAGVRLLDYYFTHSDYQERQTKRRIERLQEYVEENQLMATDAAGLTEWVKKQSVVSLQVYREGRLCYDSNYPEEAAIQESAAGREFYEWETHYTLRFCDGNAEAVLYGLFGYQFYGYATVLELVLSFLLFLAVVMVGIRRTMRYIRRLNQEIGILEGGDLDYPVTVEGKDELAMLAESLNRMRKAFQAQAEQESYLTQANKKLITEMSHDLRTPITSLLIYTEILRNGKYEGESQMREYVEKIDRKAHQMKALTERIFEYSLVSSETDIPLEAPTPARALFYDLLSEAAVYLEQNGFRTVLTCEWTEVSVRVNSGYMARIMDNLLSNILKYADGSEPVRVTVSCTGEYALLCFSNRIPQPEKEGGGRIGQPLQEGRKEDSHRIGLRSVRGMMQKMGGSCRAEEKDGSFSVSLRFPGAGRQTPG